MIGRLASPSRLGFETFGTAVGLGVVVGALSLVAGQLCVLSGTLAALAIAGWASLRYREGRPGGWVGSGTRWAALTAVAAGAVVYLDPPPPLAPLRALLLGLGLVPLWVVERRRGGDVLAGGSDR
jgi:hypothetical protein